MMASMATITLCLRHIPCKVLEPDLVETMTAMGLDTSRYTLYLPKRLGRQGRMNNFGYGFVTCRQQQDADDFTRSFQGFQFSNIGSGKRMLVEPTLENRPVGPSQTWNHADHSANSGFVQSRIQQNNQGADLDEARYWFAAEAYGGISSHSNALSEHHSWAESFDSRSTRLDEQGRAPPNGNEVPQTRLATFDHAFQFQ
eukprot:TRINITY_DN6262_c1_g3_i1.p1 TRINITY_DN6262_c1_g3~~TRINITY_DN6262_c1_g3_i1.p1  ORF type:complete len:199 (+),score=19.33 TRINITY_DN6262_c1_g3_i1:34-630(+)